MSELDLFDDDFGDRSPERSTRHAGTARQSAGRRRRGRRRRRRSAPYAPLVAVLVILVFVAGAGYVGYSQLANYMHPPDYDGSGGGSVVIRVRGGDTAATVAQTLLRRHVIASTRAFTNAAKHTAQGASIKPGFYRLRHHMKASIALDLLVSSKSRVTATVTVVDGMRASEIFALLHRRTGKPVSAYRQAASDPRQIGLPASAGGHVEGYLYPATYDFPPNSSASEQLRTMVRRYEHSVAGLSIETGARRLHLTQREVITVASLLQAEGGRESDYPKIARVIYNRIRHDDHLQLDTTVLYAEHRRSLRVYNKDLRVESPYNTYRVHGLPPGPICSPNAAAINAAIHPANGSWYYFVTTDPKRRITKFTNSPKQFRQFKRELDHNLAHR